MQLVEVEMDSGKGQSEMEISRGQIGENVVVKISLDGIDAEEESEHGSAIGSDRFYIARRIVGSAVGV